MNYHIGILNTKITTFISCEAQEEQHESKV